MGVVLRFKFHSLEYKIPAISDVRIDSKADLKPMEKAFITFTLASSLITPASSTMRVPDVKKVLPDAYLYETEGGLTGPTYSIEKVRSVVAYLLKTMHERPAFLDC